MRILIAEDERDLAEALGAFFEKNQFNADLVYDGEEAFDYAVNEKYDVIILDVMMPKYDGITVVKKLRTAGVTAPIMMLTAKGSRSDRIEGFDAGADDYLPKPFAPEELISRVRALLRRSGGYTPTKLTFGDLILDAATGTMSCGNQIVHMKSLEFQIMELLMRDPNVVFSTDKIMERVWGDNSESEINVVWAHLYNIRKKLQELDSKVQIKTYRGIGYTLEVRNE